MEPTAFVSYSQDDRGAASAIVAELELRGINCWIAPRDVSPGSSYMSSITQAIESSQLLLLVLSQSAAQSQHVLRELEVAVSSSTPILPLRLDDVVPQLDLRYALAGTQWLDIENPLNGAEVEHMVSAIHALTDQPVDHVTTSRMQVPAPDVAEEHAPRSGPRRLPLVAAAAVGLMLVVAAWIVLGRGSSESATEAETPEVPSTMQGPDQEQSQVVGLGTTFTVGGGLVDCRLDFVRYGELSAEGKQDVELGYWANDRSAYEQNGCVAWSLRDAAGYEVQGCGHSLTGVGIRNQAIRLNCTIERDTRIATVEYGALQGPGDRVIVTVE